jgi:hypothetical protein
VHDLKKQILSERMSVPNSGTKYAINRHHIQAMRSTSGSCVINCFSRPAKCSRTSHWHSELFIKCHRTKARLRILKSDETENGHEVELDKLAHSLPLEY